MLTDDSVTDVPLPALPAVISSVVDMSPQLAIVKPQPSPFDNRFEVDKQFLYIFNATGQN
jgi:hypothetical protein